MRPKVYISGPLTSSGNVLENIETAMETTRQLIAAGFAPYLPATSTKVLDTLGIDTSARQPAWERAEVSPGTELGPAVPLFSKVELPAEA